MVTSTHLAFTPGIVDRPHVDELLHRDQPVRKRKGHRGGGGRVRRRIVRVREGKMGGREQEGMVFRFTFFSGA